MDHAAKKVSLTRYKKDIKRFIGWAIFWRVTVIMMLIGGTLGFLFPNKPITHHPLLIISISIPLVGWITRHVIGKRISKEEEPQEQVGKIQGSDVTQLANQEIQRKIRRLAKTSLIFSIIWLAGIGSLIAVITGLKAKRYIRKSQVEMQGGTMASIGTIIGFIGLCVWTGIILIAIIIK